MKERLTAVFLFFLAFLTLFALVKKYPEQKKNYGTIDSSFRDAGDTSASSLTDEVIRLHIIADNDSAHDQEIKLILRDTLLPYLAAVTKAAVSKEEALSLLSGQCDTFTDIANQKLASLDVPYTATVRVEKCYFPIRIYGSRTYLSADAILFPPGMYDCLRIVLGKGEGHNWWCLAYPSLCFIDATYDYVPKNTALYKEKFATVKESSLAKLFYGTTHSFCTEQQTTTAFLPSDDKKVNIFIESKIWKLFTTKLKNIMIN